MQELSFNVQTNLGTLDANFDDLKDALKNQMSAYRELEVNEGNLVERKSDLAFLRKLRGAIDQRRKEVKKEFARPYNEFEAKVWDLIRVVDEPIELIDGQMKEIDRRRVEEKQAHLVELYNENIKEYAEYLPFESLKEKSWDNKTTKDKEIIDAIQVAVIKVENDLNSIKSLCSPIEDELIAAYKKTRDLPGVIKRAADFLRDRELIEKEKEGKVDVTVAEPIVQPVIITETPTRRGFVNFRVSVLDAGLTEELLNENDISFEREDL